MLIRPERTADHEQVFRVVELAFGQPAEALELQAGALAGVRGEVEYPPEFAEF
jgi:predicted N-acetyltransferase YhbS